MRSKNILSKLGFPDRKFIALGLLILLISSTVIAPGCSSADGSTTGNKTGNLAPDFNLTDLDGNQVRLNDLKGSVVFINFWASWCPSCRAEMPSIEAVHQKYKSQNVKVIGIDYRETASAVRQFAEENNYTVTFVLDKTGLVAYQYQISTFPTSFFIDTKGIIRAVKVGPMSQSNMEYYLALARNKS